MFISLASVPLDPVTEQSNRLGMRQHAQMDMLGPKGLGLLLVLYGEMVERKPDGTHACSRDGLSRVPRGYAVESDRRPGLFLSKRLAPLANYRQRHRRF